MSDTFAREAPPPLPVPSITIDDVLDRYDALLFDAYGVLVHTAGALPGAADLLHRLNAIGKPYLVVTNDASKLPDSAARRYQRFGLPVTPDHMLSSGMLLEPHFAARALAGARCAVLGPPDSVQYVERAGGRPVPFHEDFDVLVVGDESGYAFLETVDAVISTLFRLLDRGRPVHLVLPNPDLIYPGPDGTFGLAAGSVAAMFEGVLRLRYREREDLRFVRLGKPEPAIFEEAVRRLGVSRAVMIGDQLETDIHGARAAGLDAIWLENGVTRAIPASTPEARRPTARMTSLAGPR